MNKLFLFITVGILICVSIAFLFHVIYFPGDIIYLFPAFSAQHALIPHNTLISDPFTQFEPWRFFTKQELLSGRFPLWNNMNAGGQPFFANAQSAVLFPINFIYYFLPVSISLNLIPLLKLFFLFFFSYLYLKSIKCSDSASLLGSLAISFSGFPSVWLLWPQTNVYIFFPLLLFSTEKIVSEDDRNNEWYLLISASYLLAVLGGHPETLFHIFLIHMLYAIIRLKFKPKKIFKVTLFIIWGFCISAVQLLPFTEYFINSYSAVHRVSSASLNIPLISFIMNIFPFILGGPHLQFYRPISSTTNFQETISGYTGPIVMITAIISSFVLFSKNKFIRIWSIVSLMLFILAYKIFPFALILQLPFLRQTQNGRLAAFAAFGLCVIFALAFDNLKQLHTKYKKTFKFAKILLVISVLLGTFFVYCIPFFLKNPTFNHPFIKLLQTHLEFILTSTALFFIVIIAISKDRLKITIYPVVTLILLQTVGLFGNYAPFIPYNQYYPASPLINKLKMLKPGTVLEVGNPSILPDINLEYGISQAESYDALDIRSYKSEFDKTFSDRNQWGKVDAIGKLSDLQRFDISYILSDYSPNYYFQKVQPKYDTLLGPLIRSRVFETQFIAEKNTIREIRLLTANYNRKNTCNLNIQIIDIGTNQDIKSTSISCENIFDKMYYTIDIGDTQVLPRRKYEIKITSSNSNSQNSISLWGNSERKPYLGLLYEYGSSEIYKKLGQENGVMIFAVPGVSDVLLNGTIISKTSKNSEFDTEYYAEKESDIEVKIPFYPGWNASIDGMPVKI